MRRWNEWKVYCLNMYVLISVDGVHDTSHLPTLPDIASRVQPSSAEFSRVQRSSTSFARVRPSSAEFSQKRGFEFGQVRPSSNKFQTASSVVLGTSIKKQLQAQALSVTLLFSGSTPNFRRSYQANFLNFFRDVHDDLANFADFCDPSHNVAVLRMTVFFQDFH